MKSCHPPPFWAITNSLIRGILMHAINSTYISIAVFNHIWYINFNFFMLCSCVTLWFWYWVYSIDIWYGSYRNVHVDFINKQTLFLNKQKTGKSNTEMLDYQFDSSGKVTVAAQNKNVPVNVLSNIYGVKSISKSKCEIFPFLTHCSSVLLYCPPWEHQKT